MSNFITDKFILPINYHSQRNNKLYSRATCGTTCLGMILSYLAKKLDNNEIVYDDDEVFEILNFHFDIKK